MVTNNVSESGTWKRTRHKADSALYAVVHSSIAEDSLITLLNFILIDLNYFCSVPTTYLSRCYRHLSCVLYTAAGVDRIF